MATILYPAQMVGPEGDVVTARTARDYWNYSYAGYYPTSDPVPVDDDDGFTDASVAALIDNMNSLTFAALMRRVVGRKELVLSQTPPASPAPGTVWIDTSP